MSEKYFVEKTEKYLELLCKYIGLHKGPIVFDCKILREKLFICPCSTKHHGSYAGGLVDHLLNVYESAIKIHCAFSANLKDVVTIDQLLFCALVHDLGKLGNVEQDFYIRNPDVSNWTKTPFVINQNLISIPHEIRTIYWLNLIGVTLTEEELQAICYHAGPYMPGYLDHVKAEHPLLIMLHAADNLTTKLIER